jgi:hypothetical protein
MNAEAGRSDQRSELVALLYYQLAVQFIDIL